MNETAEQRIAELEEAVKDQERAPGMGRGVGQGDGAKPRAGVQDRKAVRGTGSSLTCVAGNLQMDRAANSTIVVDLVGRRRAASNSKG